MGLDLGPISREMRLVEDEITRSLRSTSSVLREVALYLLSAGGKRIRPAMGISAYLAIGAKEPERIIPLAAAVELIHTSTLLHDDIIDGSDTRRGRPTAHRVYGLPAAIVTGDFLFSQAFGLCSGYDPRIIGITSGACRELAEAEMLQTTPWREYTEELSLSIAKSKTGALMAAGMEVGAVVAGADPDTRARLRSYGYNVGTAFQIIDDCLDFSLGGATGKPTGSDILAGKATLPVLHALARSPERDRRLLEAYLSSSAERGSLGELVSLLERSGSIEYARARARAFASAAVSELGPMKESPYKTILEDMSQYVLERTS
jgi:geranylgeranyl pyrophosphate synthase